MEMTDVDCCSSSSHYNRRRSKSWSSPSTNSNTATRSGIRRRAGSRSGRSTEFGQIFQKKACEMQDRSSSHVTNLLSDLDLNRSQGTTPQEEQHDMSGEDTRRRRAYSACAEPSLMDEELPMIPNGCARSRESTNRCLFLVVPCTAPIRHVHLSFMCVQVSSSYRSVWNLGRRSQN